ncbi:hypothetical protein ACWD0A_27800 [Streptomyces sp. NPDC002867]
MVTRLQRLVGNRSVAALMAGQPDRILPVQRDARTPGAVAAITSFAGIDDAERLRLINVVLNQTWVGPNDEAALERIWGSLDAAGLVRFADANPQLWDTCIRRGAHLIGIRPYRDLQNQFRADITALGQHYLRVNEDLVNRELSALGPDLGPPTGEQAGRIAGLQAAAAALSNLQRAQDAARQARVGWRIGDGGDVDPDWTGRPVKYQVPFQSGQPPQLTEEPADVPHGDILLHPTVPYADVQQGWEAASQAIVRLTAVNPALYGLVRAGSSTRTEAFVTDNDAGSARTRLTAPLRQALADIATTRGNLGAALDPLDLEPLIRQLYAGQASVGGTRWAGGFTHRAAESAAVGHAIEQSLARAALQNVQQIAALLAPFTSGASLLALLAVGATAAGVEAYGSHREAQVLAAAEGAAVSPGTELVTPGSAEHARMNAEADLVAFGLALTALGAEAFAAWRAGAQARRLAAEERVRLHHGTDQTGYQGIGPLDRGRIDVTHAAGAHQDLGQGFYLTLEQDTGAVYGLRRGAQRGGGMQHVLTWDVPKADLGVIVDVRRGGPHRAQWEAFLAERPPFPGNRPLPGFETNRALLARAPEQRGVIFDRFLERIGMRSSADTVFAPLGDDVFTGITGGSEGTQVCIRSQRVADRLNQQILTGH